MTLSLNSFLITIALMMIAIIFKPTIKIKNTSYQTFWIITSLGAIVTLLTKQISFECLWSNLSNGSMNPIKILLLFLSLSMISISLDELNFFNYLSSKALERSKNNQYKIFFIVYLLVAILTIFTSNDIVILTFTPFIIHFSKKAKINPLPYLLMEFVNANTYSMLLSIGNPTNIYLSSSKGIAFLDYLSKMWLGTLFAGIATLSIILLIFHKDLAKPMEAIQNERIEVKNKPLTVINLSILAITTILLAISNYIGLEMWSVTLIAMISLSVVLLIFAIKEKDFSNLKDTYKRLPYNLIPFVISMFVLVLSLKENGVTDYLLEALRFFSMNDIATAFAYSISSTLFDNLINNIPMSILYSSLLSSEGNLATYATIIGSNIGAYLTPIGALAGIMWMSLLKKYEVKFTYLQFVKYGVILVPIALVSSTFGILLLF